MKNRTFRTRRPALVLAAGVAGTAALATVLVSGPTTSGAQQPRLVVGSSSVAATPSAFAPPTGTVRTAGGARAALTPPQVRAIAEKSVRGRAEKVDLIDPARLSYQVTLSRPDGAETKVVVDGRTGRVLSRVVERQDSVVLRDPGEAQGRAESGDSGQPHDLVEPQDSAEAGN